MKKRALLAATAIISSSFAPVLTTPAIAAVTVLDTVTPNEADATTLAAMQTQCDDLAAAHGDNWTGTLDESSIVADSTPVSGPTEVGSHTYEADGVGARSPAGTFTPGFLEILGDPYRNGGSVNMFGIQQSVGGRYSASAYDFEGEFETTFAYSFECNMSESVYIPLQGHYVVDDNGQGGDAPNQSACNAFTALGPTWPHWGQHHAQCAFVATGGDEYVDEDRPNEAGTAVNQTQIDTLLAHEDFGEGYDEEGTVPIGQVVVCISPSKTGPKGAPGTWINHNGYTGDKCTTDWYNGGAKTNVPNLNDGSHNWVTVPVV